ncbi:MAG: DNA-processing protein DprA [Candidatus Merdivicinus sp.]|jgi:DNA processing protein
MEERLRYWIWLSQCFSYGSPKPLELIEAGADPERLYQEGREYRESFGVLNTRDLSRMERISLERADVILDNCQKQNIWAISWENNLFPATLRHIYGPPVVLYGKGNLEGLGQMLRLTIVGTRDSSEYAMSVAGNLSFQLARTGVVIVSGCAVGIDEYAHRGAIRAGGRSVGILACGADVDYPAATRQVREHLLYQNGALLTELPPGTQVNRYYFPVRNRLMAGFSEGVFVVQAPQKSGALITAELAIEQGKELFCLPPCSIFAPEYLGVVPLLRDGAIPVYGVEDILSEYEVQWADQLHLEALKETVKPRRQPTLQVADQPQYTLDTKPPIKQLPEPSIEKIPKAEPIRLIGIQKDLYSMLEETPRPMDDLIRQSGKRPQEVLAALTELELLGLVRAYPGRQYGKAF